uniref:RUN domain-containing protein n=1 Tax=Oryzias sinensis TaxID=183150 RepID=A0A8C7ZX31_9TELE
KAVNTAVDLIVAHFGTSRNPDVKAKLGNSWVSPNVGHLILKYLCPALRDVLQDGLKAHVLDLIIGQRRCQPWSVVEASTQPGEGGGGPFHAVGEGRVSEAFV